MTADARNEKSIEDQNKALFHRWFGQVWNAGNYEVAREVISGTMRVHGAGGQPVEMGPDGVAGLVSTWRNAFPDGKMDVDGLIAEGGLVAALLTWHGTHQGEFYGIPASGKRVTCTSIGIDRIDNGIIVDGWGELDMVGMMQQMGAMPVAGPGATAQGRDAEWGSGPVTAGPADGDVKAVATRFVDALNAGDLGAVTGAGYREYGPIFGARDAAESGATLSALRAAMPDLRYEQDPGIVIAEGDLVAVHGLVSGTHTGEALLGTAASGKRITWSQTDMLRVRGGKVVERWVCADTLAMLQQSGVLPGGQT